MPERPCEGCSFPASAECTPRTSCHVADGWSSTPSPGSTVWTGTVLRYHRPAGINHVSGRQKLLEESTRLIVRRGVTAWALDDVPPSQRARDRSTIGHGLARTGAHHVTFDHRRSHTEPLPWAADAVCWAVGGGGDWRRRVDAIITVIDLAAP
jgi:hypothetical protein